MPRGCTPERCATEAGGGGGCLQVVCCFPEERNARSANAVMPRSRPLAPRRRPAAASKFGQGRSVRTKGLRSHSPSKIDRHFHSVWALLTAARGALDIWPEQRAAPLQGPCRPTLALWHGMWFTRAAAWPRVTVTRSAEMSRGAGCEWGAVGGHVWTRHSDAAALRFGWSRGWLLGPLERPERARRTGGLVWGRVDCGSCWGLLPTSFCRAIHFQLRQCRATCVHT